MLAPIRVMPSSSAAPSALLEFKADEGVRYLLELNDPVSLDEYFVKAARYASLLDDFTASTKV